MDVQKTEIPKTCSGSVIGQLWVVAQGAVVVMACPVPIESD